MTERLIVLPHEFNADGGAGDADAPMGLGGVAEAPLEPALSMMRHTPSVLEAAARGGFRAVELSAAPGGGADPQALRGLGRTHLRRSLRECGLAAPVLSWQGLLAERDERKRKEAVRVARDVLETTHTLGAARLSLRPAVSEAAHGESWRHLLDSLFDLEDAVRDAGVALCLEPGSDPRDALRDDESCRRLLREAPASTGFALDSAAPCATRIASADDLAAPCGHLRLHARNDSEEGLRFVRAEESRRLVHVLKSHGYAGLLAVRPDAGDEMDPASMEALRRLIVQSVLGS